MADSKGIFAVIGSSLGQLTQNIGIVGNLCKEQERTRRLSRQFLELYERVATEERMLRMRFDLPAAPRARTLGASEVVGHRYPSAKRPVEMHRRLRSSQELCRSLEEYFRFFSLPHIGRFFHRLRLDLYGFERLVIDILGPMEPPPSVDANGNDAINQTASGISEALSACPLYFILDDTLCRTRDPLRLGYDVVNAGVKLMQLRSKKLASRDLLDLARRLRHMCAESGCRLIINDRVDIALLSGADGVHLGAADLRVAEARQLGPNLLVGVTARTAQDAFAAQAAGADYIGCGAVYGSKTKPKVPVIGPSGLKSVAKAVDIPVTAIGGVTLDNCQGTLAAGAAGFCSITPFSSRRSAKNLVKEFRRICRKAPAQSMGAQ